MVDVYKGKKNMFTDEDEDYINELLFKFDSSVSIEERKNVLLEIKHEDSEVETEIMRILLFADGEDVLHM